MSTGGQRFGAWACVVGLCLAGCARGPAAGSPPPLAPGDYGPIRLAANPAPLSAAPVAPSPPRPPQPAPSSSPQPPAGRRTSSATDAPRATATTANSHAQAQLAESFPGPTLDPAKWTVTRKNDFEESTIDIVNGRLRLRAATIGTDDKTVKFHGVRTAHPILLKPPVEIGFILDWNKQFNGCYLSAGIFLCPKATDGNPRDEETMLRFEYVGVPPGKNGRSWLWTRDSKVEHLVFDEGWPKQHREGRAIGVQTVKLRWDGTKLSILENDKPLWSGPWKGFDPPQAYLYLQMSSHSNYPPRELFFDDVTVSPL